MKIKIKIKKDGTIEAKTEAVAGKKCLHIVPFLDELFEGRVLDYQLQDAFYDQSCDQKLMESTQIDDLDQNTIETLSKCHTGV